MNKCYVLLSFLFAFNSIYAQETDKKYEFLKSKTQVKNPLELRDPFKRKIIRKRTQIIQEKEDRGYFSDEASIDNIPLERLKVVGVLLGAQRRVMVKTVEGGSEIHYLKEGARIGQNGAELKAILPGGIVVVEKIRNVYDQDEYLETVIPISSE